MVCSGLWAAPAPLVARRCFARLADRADRYSHGPSTAGDRPPRPARPVHYTQHYTHRRRRSGPYKTAFGTGQPAAVIAGRRRRAALWPEPARRSPTRQTLDTTL